MTFNSQLIIQDIRTDFENILEKRPEGCYQAYKLLEINLTALTYGASVGMELKIMTIVSGDDSHLRKLSS